MCEAVGGPTILALVAFRDEANYLPGLLDNLANHVDGVIGLDDNSTDASAEIVERHPLTRQVLRSDRGPGSTHDDYILHSTLTRAAWAHGSNWLLGIDADERLAANFREALSAAVESHPCAGGFWVPMRECWSPCTVRVDGVWGRKRAARVFPSDPDHTFNPRRLHGSWPSVSTSPEDWPEIGSTLYHLRMMTPAGRSARLAKYKKLDPDNRYQAIGYDYLTEESDLSEQLIPDDDLATLFPPEPTTTGGGRGVGKLG